MCLKFVYCLEYQSPIPTVIHSCQKSVSQEHILQVSEKTEPYVLLFVCCCLILSRFHRPHVSQSGGARSNAKPVELAEDSQPLRHEGEALWYRGEGEGTGPTA